MRRLARLLLAAAVVLLPLLGAHGAGAQVLAGEHVQSYDVAMTLPRDGSLPTKEPTPYAWGVVPGQEFSRALGRRDPSKKPPDRRYRIAVESITDGAGAPIRYTRSTNGPYLHLKI